MCGSVSNPGGFQLQSSTFHPNLCRHCSELTSNPRSQTGTPNLFTTEGFSSRACSKCSSHNVFFYPQANRSNALCLCLIQVIKQITQILHRQLCRDVFFDVLTEVTKPLTKNMFGFVTFHFQQNKSHFYRLELDLRKLSDMNFFRILLIRVFCDCNCPLGPFCPLLFLPSFDIFLKSSGLVSKICDRSLSST